MINTERFLLPHPKIGCLIEIHWAQEIIDSLKLWPEILSLSGPVLQALKLSLKSNLKTARLRVRNEKRADKQIFGNSMASLLHFLQHANTARSQRGSNWHCSALGDVCRAEAAAAACPLMATPVAFPLGFAQRYWGGREEGHFAYFCPLIFIFPSPRKETWEESINSVCCNMFRKWAWNFMSRSSSSVSCAEEGEIVNKTKREDKCQVWHLLMTCMAFVPRRM